MPVRTRLTIVFAALMAVVVAASAVLLYVRLRATLRESVDAGLRSRAQVLIAALEKSGISLQEGTQLIDPGDAFAQLAASDGSVLDLSPGLTTPLIPAPTLASLAAPSYLERTVQAPEGEVPARLFAIPAPGGTVVVVGASLDDTRDTLASLARWLAIGGPVALALTTVIVWLLAGAALRPVERMRSEAEALSASEPGRRLNIPRTKDEVARLGETLNRLLARLEEALERERRFVDDASHELRTPLAILQAELDLALRRARTPAELEAALESAAEESQRLSRLADHLLVLARSDRGRLEVRKMPVDIREMVARTTARFATRANALGITIKEDVPADTTARIDVLKVEQAISNLLENALGYTPRNGTIEVRIERSGQELVVHIADSGPGFSSQFIPRAFEPFSRTDGARGREEGGAGLGLAIVRAIVEAHDGSVQAFNRVTGGAEVILRIPTASDSAA
jgi:two-component system OmpR family sensor kinase